MQRMQNKREQLGHSPRLSHVASVFKHGAPHSRFGQQIGGTSFNTANTMNLRYLSNTSGATRSWMSSSSGTKGHPGNGHVILVTSPLVMSDSRWALRQCTQYKCSPQVENDFITSGGCKSKQMGHSIEASESPELEAAMAEGETNPTELRREFLNEGLGGARIRISFSETGAD